jgi:protease PrsW
VLEKKFLLYNKTMFTPQALFLALSGGILPALFWLWFWLREDRLHPEPRGLVILTFFGGMLAAIISLPVEQFIRAEFNPHSLTTLAPVVLILWALTEEFLKFFFAYFFAVNRKTNHEPSNPLMYLITSALGFAALENTLFLLNPILAGNFIEAITTGSNRFIGATLLHTTTSAIIGLFLALYFYRSKRSQKIHAFFGLIIATLLHTLFNFFIIQGNNAFLVFATVWLAVVFLLLAFEKVERMHPVR